MIEFFRVQVRIAALDIMVQKDGHMDFVNNK